MKRFKWVSLAILFLFVSSSLFAQTVDEIINKHIEAIGGKDNWKKINSIKLEATINTQGIEIPVFIYQVHNKAMKSEFNVQGMNNYSIVTTDSGWRFFPIMGQASPEPITPDELKSQQDGLDIQGEFLDYKDKGHTVELLGNENVEGTDAFKIRLKRKTGTEIVYLIDSKTYYIIRAISKVFANGQETEQTAIMSNYQKLPEGIVVPFTMEGIAPAAIVVSKVEVNPVFDASLFKVSQ